MLDRIRRAPSKFGVPGLAGDVAWTTGYQVLTVFTIAASFLMLGRELGPGNYGEYVGLFAVTTPLATVGYAAGLSVVQFTFREGFSADDAAARFWSLVLIVGAASSVIAVAVASWTLSLGLVEIVAIAVSELIVGSSIRVLAAFAACARRRRRADAGGDRLHDRALRRVGGAVRDGFVDGAESRHRMARGLHRLHVRAGVRLVAADRSAVAARGGRVRTRSTSVVQMGAPMFANNFQINGDKIVFNADGFRVDAGHYGAAFRMVSMATLPIQSMESALFHRFLESDDDALGEHTTRAVRYSFLFLAVVIPMAVFIWFLAPHLGLPAR